MYYVVLRTYLILSHYFVLDLCCLHDQVRNVEFTTYDRIFFLAVTTINIIRTVGYLVCESKPPVGKFRGIELCMCVPQEKRGKAPKISQKARYDQALLK